MFLLRSAPWFALLLACGPVGAAQPPVQSEYRIGARGAHIQPAAQRSSRGAIFRRKDVAAGRSRTLAIGPTVPQKSHLDGNPSSRAMTLRMTSEDPAPIIPIFESR